jgi:3-oxoacyl-[acyl-carrier-protein] synthase-3
VSFRIESVKFKLGENQISVRDICTEVDRDYDRLIARSGFELVHRTSYPEEDFFRTFILQELSFREHDFVIFVNQSMSNKIPGKISGLFSNISLQKMGFLELSDGCTGFTRALLVASSLLESPITSRVHIICAEKYSNFYDNLDESVSPIFSDAISATTLTRDGGVKVIGSQIVNFFGNFEAISINRDELLREKLHMGGAQVLNWAVREVPNVVQSLLNENNLSVTDVNSWYLHQGSRIVVESLCATLGIDPAGKFDSSQIGNTVSSTIPILVSRNFDSSRNAYLSKGYSMLISFGVGLSIVATLIKIEE